MTIKNFSSNLTTTAEYCFYLTFKKRDLCKILIYALYILILNHSYKYERLNRKFFSMIYRINVISKIRSISYELLFCKLTPFISLMQVFRDLFSKKNNNLYLFYLITYQTVSNLIHIHFVIKISIFANQLLNYNRTKRGKE